MDMQSENRRKPFANIKNLLPIYICFLVFGALVPFTKEEFSIITLLSSIILSLLIGFLITFILILTFKSLNANLTRENRQFALESVATGMLFMIPFTVLAFIAQVILGWNALTPFASAAIMTASTSAGSEAMKMGAKGIKNVIVSSGIAFLISTIWMIFIGILP